MTRPRRPPPAAALPLRSLPVIAAALAAPSCTLFHQDLPNVPPVVRIAETDTTQVKRGGRVTLRVAASDEDDDPLPYLWQAEAGSLTDSTGSVTDWIAPKAIAGASEIFLITVRIRDGDLETEDPVESFEIEVVQRPPALRSVPASRAITAGDTLVLSARGVDKDGDDLTYVWRFRAGSPTRADRNAVRLLDEAGEDLATARSLGVGSHHAGEAGSAWILQHRSATERDSARVRFVPLAEAVHEIEIAVTDAIDSPSDTVSAWFSIQVEAAGNR